MYDLDTGIVEGRLADNKRILAIFNYCRELGRELKPICMMNNEMSSKYGSIDLVNIQFENEPALWCGIVDFYQSELGTVFDLNLDVVNSICSDYFMRACLCYIEQVNEEPKTYGQFGGYEQKYTTVKDKFLACKNPFIMGYLEGIPTNVSISKYEDNYDIEPSDINEYLIPYLKIKDMSGASTTITKCRKRLDTYNIRFMALPFISSWLQGLYEVMEDNIVRIKYIKDDGTERTIDTTLNRKILESIYSQEHSEFMIKSCIRSNTFDGDAYYLPFQGNPQRGWVRLPELGSSAIDDGGTRAVNFVRIASAEVISIEDVDLTFVNVTLGSTEQYMFNRINECEIKSDLSTLKGIYSGLREHGFKSELSYPVTVYHDVVGISGALKMFLNKNQYVGTSFRKSLHIFMISNPELFPNYIGIKVPTQVKGHGVEEE